MNSQQASRQDTLTAGKEVPSNNVPPEIMVSTIPNNKMVFPFVEQLMCECVVPWHPLPTAEPWLAVIHTIIFTLPVLA